MEAYINGISAISPQNTFSGGLLPIEPVGYSGIRSLKCIEPKYSDFIDPMVSRRMSRIIRMGVCAALKCLSEAGIRNPGAIITGTGLGCVEDTGKFLNSVYENEEKLLNPTPFIQSTHNTVAASIALLLKCNNYNSTYGHRAFSLESALIDGLMLLNEGSAENVLVGALDEMTPELFSITDRLGFWKRQAIDNLTLGNSGGRGTIAGEGAAFFMLAGSRTETSYAKICSIRMLYRPSGIDETKSWIREVTGNGNPGLVILGINGDEKTDTVYEQLIEEAFAGIPALYYKHLCGEYDTSAAFALAMAAGILREKRIPEIMKTGRFPDVVPSRILVYNHLRNTDHSAILVESC
ncbi:MAG: beta-ketoacyl synthase chain length factor [Bacteroidales bacterium]|jgi:hypothetical protein|nr:beta-ketoacyl synthase chain length factor [Bacteroidales bacterium]